MIGAAPVSQVTRLGLRRRSSPGVSDLHEGKMRGRGIMFLIFDGNSEIGAHVCIEMIKLICFRHLFGLIKKNQFSFTCAKRDLSYYLTYYHDECNTP